MKLLVLTGQRRGEVVNMHWQHLDMEAALWKLPKEMTQSLRAHTVPLTKTVMSIVQNIPHTHDRFQFPALGSETTNFYGVEKCKRRLDTASGVYNRFGYLDEMQEALTKWDNKIKRYLTINTAMYAL